MKQQTTPALSLEWFLKPRILFMLLGPLLLVYLLIKTIGLYKTAADTAHVSQPQRFQDTTYPSSFLNTTTTTAAAAFRANNGTSFLRAAGMRNDTQGNINGHHKSHKVGVMTGAAINATSNTTVAAVPATATAAAASIAATPSSAANSSSTNTTVSAVANATAPANATRQQR